MPSLSDIVYDTWVTIGIDQAPDLSAGETDVSILVDPNIPSWEIDFASGGNLDISSSIGGGWYILPSSANGISGDDQKVLIAQATTDGDLSGQFFIQIFPNGDQSQLIENTFSFAASACGTPGCTDATACNYDDQATVDDGSCQQLDACGVCGGNGIPEGDCDCAGNSWTNAVCGGGGIPAGDCDCNEISSTNAVCGGRNSAGDCDCNGNQLDALGVWRPCAADADGDGTDDQDDCVGSLDECGSATDPAPFRLRLFRHSRRRLRLPSQPA